MFYWETVLLNKNFIFLLLHLLHKRFSIVTFTCSIRSVETGDHQKNGPVRMDIAGAELKSLTSRKSNT
jgi:hypothetical protein